MAIAAVGAFLAWQQVWIARKTVWHDLFDRRFAVYETARTFLALVMARGGATAEDVNSYSLGINEAQFLMNRAVQDYLFEIRRRAVALGAFEKAVQEMPASIEKEVLTRRRLGELGWLVAQIDVLPEKFRPFLTLQT
ncbi:MAG TPA: hypothetical protein VJ846_01265 [Sphingomicrobium sp.]|nr:hypothetical protein [Sphingomicrobium sp.]